MLETIVGVVVGNILTIAILITIIGITAGSIDKE